MPVQPALTLSRPLLTARMASDSPRPTSPSTLAAGTTTPSSTTSQQLTARTGSCGRAVTWYPLAPRSTRKAVIPRAPRPGSTVASTTPKSP